MKKRKIKNKKLSLFDVIENEIKFNGLRQGFSKNLIKFSTNLKKKETSDHSDFTHIPFITIDGEDSKDFDDAIWSKNNNKTTKIMVAIADVSFYVKSGDPIDLEAKKRGNSFYFPDRVIPMLPEVLSNDLCSLLPQKKRKSVIVEINLDNGEINSFKIHRAIIKSVARLTYQEAENIFNKKQRNNKLFKLIDNLFKSYKFLCEISQKRNKISFDPDEFIIKTNKKGFIDLIKKKKLESYKLIEEFMTLANTVVGGILKKNNIKSIFRNHEKPPQDKTKELDQIISEYKLEHSGNFHLQKDFNKIIKIIRNKKLSFLNDFLLRSQSKALYSSENKGHFGLSLNYYVHFTSPIRRYSDLIVHRDLINFYFYKKKKSNEDFTEHLNIQEKKAQSIERSIFEMASCFFLKRYKNYEFKGFIDSIESFGLFIKAINFPFSGLARNTFEHNHFKFSKKKNQKFRLGQLVKFKIKRINERNGKILLHNVKELPNE